MWVLEQEKGVKIVGEGVEASVKIIKKFFFFLIREIMEVLLNKNLFKK